MPRFIQRPISQIARHYPVFGEAFESRPRPIYRLRAAPLQVKRLAYPAKSPAYIQPTRCSCESGVILRRVYFPVDSVVSPLYLLEDGGSAEIAVVGNDDVVGISLFMGGETTPSRAVVQSAGRAYCLDSKLLKAEFVRGEAMQHLLLRYTQAFLTQMAQTAVCNRHHSLDQQLCRWLLLSLDRLSSLIPVTDRLRPCNK